MEAIWRGFLFGAALALFVGPVFFALLQASIERGRKAGFVLALGIFLSDAIFMLLAFYGISSVRDQLKAHPVAGIIGGTLLFSVGVYTLLRPDRSRPPKVDDGGETRLGLARQFAKGFVVNILNPSTLLYWFGVVGTVTVSYDFSQNQLLGFFITTVLTILAFDIVKVLLAVRLRPLMKPRAVSIMRMAIGVLMIVFGLSVVWRYASIMSY